MLRFILSIKILCSLKYLWGVRLCVRSALVSCLLHLQQWESQSVQLSEELSTNTTPWQEHSSYQTDSKVRIYLSYPLSCVIISLQNCFIRGSLYIIHFPNFPNCQIVILEMWSISCVLTLIITVRMLRCYVNGVIAHTNNLVNLKYNFYIYNNFRNNFLEAITYLFIILCWIFTEMCSRSMIQSHWILYIFL